LGYEKPGAKLYGKKDMVIQMFHLFSRRTEDEKRLDELAKSAKAEEMICPACKSGSSKAVIIRNYYTCPCCGKYFHIPPRDRVYMLSDKNSFKEIAENVSSIDFLKFPGYQEKLDKAIETTDEKSAVLCGTICLDGFSAAVFVMDPRFIMASMGSAVGEKITRTFETAQKKHIPVIGITASGGARMQEGITSLMQMAKCSGAIKNFSNAGGLYVTVLSDPTTGGVTASFAMQGDIILAEPHALVGFAGRRVIEQTTKAQLPDNFQTAEFLLEHGFVDNIIPREQLRNILSQLLKMHAQEGSVS